jgi:hypothetical protein
MVASADRSSLPAPGDHRRRYARRVPRPDRALALALLMLALAAGGCYSLAEPSLRPGDSRDILLALTRRGVEVESTLAGESACGDPGLIANALHMRVSVPADPEPRDLYLYLFRARDWERSATGVDACQAEYAAAHPAALVARVDVPTYRAFGADWSTELESAVREALEEAATQGR